MEIKTPKNIVEAYKIASQVVSMEFEEKSAAFEKVIDFCESSHSCRMENSLKRNTLLFWAYNKCAQAKFDMQQFDKAVDMWLKAIELTDVAIAKIEVGDKILKSLEQGDVKISVKAKLIAKVASIVGEACQKTGQQEKALRMQRLQNTAEFVLNPSKFKH